MRQMGNWRSQRPVLRRSRTGSVSLPNWPSEKWRPGRDTRTTGKSLARRDMRTEQNKVEYTATPTTIDDADVMHLLKVMLKASGKKGVPQGGVISPLLSNLYLSEVDKMLERGRADMLCPTFNSRFVPQADQY